MKAQVIDNTLIRHGYFGGEFPGSTREAADNTGPDGQKSLKVPMAWAQVAIRPHTGSRLGISTSRIASMREAAANWAQVAINKSRKGAWMLGFFT
jgi:hypothetical protein